MFIQCFIEFIERWRLQLFIQNFVFIFIFLFSFVDNVVGNLLFDCIGFSIQVFYYFFYIVLEKKSCQFKDLKVL